MFQLLPTCDIASEFYTAGLLYVQQVLKSDAHLTSKTKEVSVIKGIASTKTGMPPFREIVNGAGCLWLAIETISKHILQF